MEPRRLQQFVGRVPVGVHVAVERVAVRRARDAIGSFVGFIVLVAVSAAIDPSLPSGAPVIPNGVIVDVLRAEPRRRCQHRVRAAAVLRARARTRACPLRAAAAQRAARAGGSSAEAPARHHRRRPLGRERAVRRHRRVHAAVRAALRHRARDAPRSRVRAMGCTRGTARRREDQDHRDAYMVAARRPLTTRRPRRRARRAAPSRWALELERETAATPGTAGTDRYRQRAGRRRRDRPGEVQLRPLG